MIDIKEELIKIFPADCRYSLTNFSIYVEYGTNEFELELYDKELGSRIKITIVNSKDIKDLEEKINKTLIMTKI